MHNTITGVDLAKDEIQVCTTHKGKVRRNHDMTPNEFSSFLANSKPMTIVFEACSTSNYWKQTALAHGHDARLISAKLVSTVRQNQKTDKNDALAIVQASQLTDINFINGKSRAQQELQTIIRLRDLAVKQKVASKRQLNSLLLEFNIRLSINRGGMNSAIQAILEDAENGFSDHFREALHTAWKNLLTNMDQVKRYDSIIRRSANAHRECKKLQKIEGVGPLNAINLYLALGCSEIGEFKKGRDAAACIGLTPIQHTSGGKTKLGSVGKYIKNGPIRSCLVNGAMAVIAKVSKREAKTKKDLWIQNLVDRRGKKCAAVALANKTVRTAFAILKNDTEYSAEPMPL